ncbi:hypothetical protein L218DRAFT_1080951, partial [Marasmius fiardii PR-910]
FYYSSCLLLSSKPFDAFYCAYKAGEFPYEPDFLNPPPQSALVVANIQPLTVEEEARLALLFQHFVLSRYSNPAKDFVVSNDPSQKLLYCTGHDQPVNFFFWAKLGQLSSALCHVGFLSTETALTPGAVEAWIESVNAATGHPESLPLRSEYQFYSFIPNSGRFIPGILDVAV